MERLALGRQVFFDLPQPFKGGRIQWNRPNTACRQASASIPIADHPADGPRTPTFLTKRGNLEVQELNPLAKRDQKQKRHHFYDPAACRICPCSSSDRPFTCRNAAKRLETAQRPLKIARNTSKTWRKHGKNELFSAPNASPCHPTRRAASPPWAAKPRGCSAAPAAVPAQGPRACRDGPMSRSPPELRSPSYNKDIGKQLRLIIYKISFYIL